MALHLEIITPIKIVYKEDVDQVTIPTVTGEITVLPNHVSMLSQIAAGIMVVKKGNQTTEMAITGGFLEIANNTVSILSDYAIKGEDVSVAEAEEAKKRAERMIQERGTEHDFRVAEGELQKAILQLRVANKMKHRRHTQVQG